MSAIPRIGIITTTAERIDREMGSGRIPSFGAAARTAARGRSMVITIALSVLILIVLPQTAEAQGGGSMGDAPRTGQHAGSFRGEVDREIEIRHLLFLPRGYASDGRRAIRAEGGDARLTVLEGRDHSSLDAYENRELYAWLLRHTPASRRAAGPP